MILSHQSQSKKIPFRGWFGVNSTWIVEHAPRVSRYLKIQNIHRRRWGRLEAKASLPGSQKSVPAPAAIRPFPSAETSFSPLAVPSLRSISASLITWSTSRPATAAIRACASTGHGLVPCIHALTSCRVYPITGASFVALPKRAVLSLIRVITLLFVVRVVGIVLTSNCWRFANSSHSANAA